MFIKNRNKKHKAI